MAVHPDDVIAGGLMRLLADIAALQAKLAAQAAGGGPHLEGERLALARAADLAEARLRALGRQPPGDPGRLERMASIGAGGAAPAELAADLHTALQALDLLAAMLPLAEDPQTAFVLDSVADCHRQTLARLGGA